MPYKPCAKCDKLVGVRTLRCACGSETFVRLAKPARNSVSVVNNITVNPSIDQTKTVKPSFYADSCGTFNLDPGNAFDGLYGKDEPLSIILASLKAYNETRGESRYNCLAAGSVSAGKSELLNRIELMVGKENVFRFNGESASLAGVQNELLTYPGDIPSLLIAEEIDKCPNPDSLLWMLAALDTRRELIKISGREGIERRKVPFICLATCNSIEKLERWHSGAILSRFPNTFFIEDMTEEVMTLILTDKLKTLPYYDVAWIPPAIEFCRTIGNMQMRKIESVLMCGQEKLLTGEYQATLLKASRFSPNNN